MPVLLLLGSLLLSGCFGLAVGTFGTFESGKEMGSRFSATREELVRERGAPDAIETHGRCEALIYRDGWSWSGVGAFLGVVPVPLLVPSGRDEEKIYLRDGLTVGEVSEYGEVTGMLGFMCGDNECGFAAGRVNLDQTRTAAVPWCE